MDKILSTITPERIMEILKEKTNSGIPRLARIKTNNSALFENIGSPKNITKSLASELIEWNEYIYDSMPDVITGSISEIENYSELLDLSFLSLDKLDNIIPMFKAFTYKDLSSLLREISTNSKLTTRINNLKFLCAYSERKNINDYTKNYLREQLISELAYQKAYLHIFKNNMKEFMDNSFPLGLLLYDIPASSEYELNFLNELKKHGIGNIKGKNI